MPRHCVGKDGHRRQPCPTPIPLPPARHRGALSPGHRGLTPSSLGCDFLKPLTWNEDTVGAGGTELEASWAARGSVAGMTSVMILTPPESVTVAAIACGQSGAGEAVGWGPGDTLWYSPAPHLAPGSPRCSCQRSRSPRGFAGAEAGRGAWPRCPLLPAGSLFMEIPSGLSCSMRGLCQQEGQRLRNPHMCEPEVGTPRAGRGVLQALPRLPPAHRPSAHQPCNQPPAEPRLPAPGLHKYLRLPVARPKYLAPRAAPYSC